MFFAQMISMIGFSSIFPFLPLYVHSLGTVTRLSPEFCAGLVYSGQAFTMMMASPVWGALADRWGRKIMVQRAMFGGAAVMLLMAFVRSAEELVALRMLQGLITGTIGATNALVAAAVPRGRTGYAMGLLQTGMGLGLGLGPVIGGTVADAFGYRAAFFITSGLLAAAGLVVAGGIREHFSAPAPATTRGGGLVRRWRAGLTARGLPLIYSLRFINQSGRIIFIPVLPMFILSLMKNQAGSNSFTGLVLGFSSAATAVSSIYLGRLGDRIGHRPVVIAGFMACAMSFALQTLAIRGWQLFSLQVVFGIAVGAVVPGISALMAGCTHRGNEGAVYGLDTSITSGARVLGPMLGVLIVTWFGTRAVFGAASLLYLAAGLVALIGLPRTPPLDAEAERACRQAREN